MSFIFKCILVVGCWILSGPVQGQHYSTPAGEFMDTASEAASACLQAQNYYYNVRGKYPVNPVRLTGSVNQLLNTQPFLDTGDGYITFRFTISCNGKLEKRIQVLQTDTLYHAHHFDKQFVESLYAFLKTLDRWKIVTWENKQYSYKSFMTFKVSHGKVISMLP